MDDHATSRHAPLLLLAAAAFVGLGALWVGLAYPTLPAEIPLARGPGGTIAGPRSLLNVGRLPGMGLGQLGAAWAMTRASRTDPGWERFWSLAGLVAGVKTLAECAQLATGGGTGLAVAAGAPVALFLGWAVLAWRGGRLAGQPRVDAANGAILGLSLLLWLGLSTSPLWR